MTTLVQTDSEAPVLVDDVLNIIIGLLNLPNMINFGLVCKSYLNAVDKFMSLNYDSIIESWDQPQGMRYFPSPEDVLHELQYFPNYQKD